MQCADFFLTPRRFFQANVVLCLSLSERTANEITDCDDWNIKTAVQHILMNRALSREALDRHIYLFVSFFFPSPPDSSHMCKTFKMFHLYAKRYNPNVLEHLKKAHLQKLVGFVSRDLSESVSAALLKRGAQMRVVCLPFPKLNRLLFKEKRFQNTLGGSQSADKTCLECSARREPASV